MPTHPDPPEPGTAEPQARPEPRDVTRTNRLHLFAPRYRKTVTIRAVRLDFPFTVQSKEGLLTGKPGDYLAIADDDSDEYPHRWIIDGETFARTYTEASDERTP